MQRRGRVSCHCRGGGMGCEYRVVEMVLHFSSMIYINVEDGNLFSYTSGCRAELVCRWSLVLTLTGAFRYLFSSRLNSTQLKSSHLISSLLIAARYRHQSWIQYKGLGFAIRMTMICAGLSLVRTPDLIPVAESCQLCIFPSFQLSTRLR